MRILALAILLTAGLFAPTVSLIRHNKALETEMPSNVKTSALPQATPEPLRQDVRNVTPPDMTQPPMLETATIGRLPAVVPPPPPVRPVKPQPFAKPEVVSAGLLQSGKTLIVLHGIEPLGRDASCKSDDRDWPCGAFARTAMQRLVRQRTVECTDPQGKAVDHNNAGTKANLRCSLAGHDLSAWLVQQGWAVPVQTSEFAAELAAAKDAGLGQWGKAPQN